MKIPNLSFKKSASSFFLLLLLLMPVGALSIENEIFAIDLQSSFHYINETLFEDDKITVSKDWESSITLHRQFCFDESTSLQKYAYSFNLLMKENFSIINSYYSCPFKESRNRFAMELPVALVGSYYVWGGVFQYTNKTDEVPKCCELEVTYSFVENSAFESFLYPFDRHNLNLKLESSLLRGEEPTIPLYPERQIYGTDSGIFLPNDFSMDEKGVLLQGNYFMEDFKISEPDDVSLTDRTLIFSTYSQTHPTKNVTFPLKGEGSKFIVYIPPNKETIEGPRVAVTYNIEYARRNKSRAKWVFFVLLVLMPILSNVLYFSSQKRNNLPFAINHLISSFGLNILYVFINKETFLSMYILLPFISLLLAQPLFWFIQKKCFSQIKEKIMKNNMNKYLKDLLTTVFPIVLTNIALLAYGLKVFPLSSITVAYGGIMILFLLVVIVMKRFFPSIDGDSLINGAWIGVSLYCLTPLRGLNWKQDFVGSLWLSSGYVTVAVFVLLVGYVFFKARNGKSPLEKLKSTLRTHRGRARRFYASALAGVLTGLSVGIFFNLITNEPEVDWINFGSLEAIKGIIFFIFLILSLLIFYFFGLKLVRWLDAKIALDFHISFIAGIYSSIITVLIILFEGDSSTRNLIGILGIILFFPILYFTVRKKWSKAK